MLEYDATYHYVLVNFSKSDAVIFNDSVGLLLWGEL